ncbi:hypothetical protein [Caulifigura coniformis]|uniref:hypothetical protein n=1 Tax=Caulifigura coniformis TaxID=2527983 RepID=UPI0011AA8FE6|nr:hypothetical protein [Caulifigura coniformis]
MLFSAAHISAADPVAPSDENVPTPIADSAFTTTVRQVTVGPKHHFFGYFGHVQTIPWNQSGRFLIALRTDFQDRMPRPGEAAEIVQIDTRKNDATRTVDVTRGWNFQQGAMLYWNPEAAETQFFFNDRDPETQEVFCVLFDVTTLTRIREYRVPGMSIGNGGVAQNGGAFLGINYGRMARLRPVTGYPGAHDQTADRPGHPDDDGIFRIDAKTGEKRLLVSYRQMADAIRPLRPDVDEKELFINHTLWSRDDSRIYFFARGDFDVDGKKRLDIPFTMNADGTNLKPLARHIGGHPEWFSGDVLIGHVDGRQVLFDVETQAVVGMIGTPESIPSPGGDIALSADRKWFLNAYGRKDQNFYNVVRLADGAWTRTAGFSRGGYTSGVLRIDPSPNWNRDATQFLFVAVDDAGTRQIHVATIEKRPTK